VEQRKGEGVGLLCNYALRRPLLRTAAPPAASPRAAGAPAPDHQRSAPSARRRRSDGPVSPAGASPALRTAPSPLSSPGIPFHPTFSPPPPPPYTHPPPPCTRSCSGRPGRPRWWGPPPPAQRPAAPSTCLGGGAEGRRGFGYIFTIDFPHTSQNPGAK
jgi:hypothetical protein